VPLPPSDGHVTHREHAERPPSTCNGPICSARSRKGRDAHKQVCISLLTFVPVSNIRSSPRRRVFMGDKWRGQGSANFGTLRVFGGSQQRNCWCHFLQYVNAFILFNSFVLADRTPGIRECLISPLFVSTFNANQYMRQRRLRSTEVDENVSEEPLPPPTFGEMRFTRVPDTAASGGIAGALLTSWKCELLLRSGTQFPSLRFLSSWIPPCSSRSCHLRSFLCHPPTDRK